MPAQTRLMVFQPLLAAGGNLLDYRILGVQFWLAERFSGAGLEAVSGLLTKPGRVKQLTASTEPSDEQLLGILREHRCAHGLLTSFDVREDSAALDTRIANARLVGLRDEAFVDVARIAFEGETNALP